MGLFQLAVEFCAAGLAVEHGLGQLVVLTAGVFEIAFDVDVGFALLVERCC
ncbi:MAG: hypothetical protein WC247_10330 [Porticoccaceae bacterium]